MRAPDPTDPEYEPPRPPSLRFPISVLVTLGLIGLGILITAVFLVLYPVGVERPQVDQCGSIARPAVLVDDSEVPLELREQACAQARGQAAGEAGMAGFSGAVMLGGSIAYFTWSLRRRRRFFDEAAASTAAE